MVEQSPDETHKRNGMPSWFWICASALVYLFVMWPRGVELNEEIPEVGNDAPTYVLEELRQNDGTGEDGTILIAILGRVFNVTSGKEFYAQGQGYHALAGRDCTRAIALMGLNATVLDKGLEDVPDAKIHDLNKTYWDTYVAKYPIVGRLEDPPYNASDYDHLVGKYIRIQTTARVGQQPGKRRQSRCPVTRAARAIGRALVNLIPRQLAPPEPSGQTDEEFDSESEL